MCMHIMYPSHGYTVFTLLFNTLHTTLSYTVASHVTLHVHLCISFNCTPNRAPTLWPHSELLFLVLHLCMRLLDCCIHWGAWCIQCVASLHYIHKDTPCIHSVTPSLLTAYYFTHEVVLVQGSVVLMHTTLFVPWCTALVCTHTLVMSTSSNA